MTNEMKASFDLTTMDGQMKAFNAKNGASVSLKTLDHGTVIECDGVMLYSDIVDTYGNDQESVITTIFATDGKSYAGISDTVAKAAEGLIEFIGATGIETFKLMVTKQKSAKGNEFLNLQLVK